MAYTDADIDQPINLKENVAVVVRIRPTDSDPTPTSTSATHHFAAGGWAITPFSVTETDSGGTGSMEFAAGSSSLYASAAAYLNAAGGGGGAGTGGGGGAGSGGGGAMMNGAAANGGGGGGAGVSGVGPAPSPMSGGGGGGGGVNSAPMHFERVFGPAITTQRIYELAAKPIVDQVMQGFNGRFGRVCGGL
jgi:hypothetical protein